VVESSTGQLKRLLTVAGDIRSDIAFQNDVNALLATVSRMSLLDQPGRRGDEHGINVTVPAIDDWQRPRRRRAS
jgi:hypothetical protein